MRAQRLIVQEATQSLEALLRSQETLRGMAAAARACQKDCVPSQAPALMSRRLSRSFDVSWAGCFGSFKSGQESGLLSFYSRAVLIFQISASRSVSLSGVASGTGRRPEVVRGPPASRATRAVSVTLLPVG